MNSANQVGKWMRQFFNVTNKSSRATDLLRSTGLNDDSPSHRKPVMMQKAASVVAAEPALRTVERSAAN
jgi:hypothetical protein